MKFTETPLKGAYLIDLEKRGDERGFFARFFCTQEFEKMGLEKSFVQGNNSSSAYKGTLRGMHYQLTPKRETKLVRCLKGTLYDVILDLREDSPTFGKHFGAELTAENRTMMYVPEGFAHGFITLQDDSEVLYMVSDSYAPELERGVRWNDPTFNIEWPIQPTIVSDRDSKHPNFNPAYHLAKECVGA